MYLAENKAKGTDKTIAINVPSTAISIVSIMENTNDLKSEKSGGNILEKISPSKRGTILLNLEDELCKVNNKIRIWHIPLGDKNSLRNLRGIKF